MRSILTTTSSSWLLVAAIGVSALGGCVAEGSDDSEAEAALSVDERFQEWEETRAKRQAKLDAYLAENAEAYRSFLYTPLGSTGVPVALMGIMPVIFPDIWGAPAERMAAQGFGPDPFNAANPLPLGFGVTTTPEGVKLANLTCGGCHTGRVALEDGRILHLIGAPNTQFNQFRVALGDTVKDPRWDAVFGSNAQLMYFKQKVLEGRALSAATLGAWTYNPLRFPNAPNINLRDKPGFLDAIGFGVTVLTLPEILDPAQAAAIVQKIMPPAPAQIDIMSIWRQRARSVAQWDGSIANPIYRNIAASVGVIGQPSAVNFHNAALTAQFSLDLPSAPYPFRVDSRRAERGEKLFDAYCSDCHKEKSTRIFSAEYTGTDPNRTFTITNGARERFIPTMRSACTDPVLCNVPDNDIVRDLSAPGARGYIAPPLDGIWARAPYLHNGSVPTLYHLLVPESRPKEFVRGNIHYDQAKVGFAWDDSAKADKYTYLFKTSEAGAANTGHDTLDFNGLDWSHRPEQLEDLLEFLKTL